MRTKQEIIDELSSEARIGTLWTNGKQVLAIDNVDDSGIEFSNGYCPNWYEIASQWEPVESYLVVFSIIEQSYVSGIEVGRTVFNEDPTKAIQYVDTEDSQKSLERSFGREYKVIRAFNR